MLLMPNVRELIDKGRRLLGKDRRTSLSYDQLKAAALIGAVRCRVTEMTEQGRYAQAEDALRDFVFDREHQPVQRRRVVEHE
jgi:hypothetical protein